MGAMLSPLCRQVRHTACVAAGGDTQTCGCKCHYDDDMTGVVESPESIGDPGTLARPMALVGPGPPIPRAAAPTGRVPCRVPTCDRDFGSAHAEITHFGRAHKTVPNTEVDDVIDEHEEPVEDPDVTEVWSPLVQDALAAVSFLEGRDENDIVHEVMDEWAGRMRTDFHEISQAIVLRQKYRELQGE